MTFDIPTRKIVKGIREKKFKAVEVAQFFLDRIALSQPKINAVAELHKEQVLDEAKAADKAIEKGLKVGRLHGLPVSFKDAIAIKSYKNTYGTLGLKNNVIDYDGTIVKRLREEGAIVLATTNIPETYRSFETDNLIYGRTNNPYDVTKTSGGSSGGEAALIAVGGSPVGIGSDGGGSIRLPAHFCGIAGIKPSQGRVPMSGATLAADGAGRVRQFGTFGPMGRFVDDISFILPFLCGSDSIDVEAVDMPLYCPSLVKVDQLKVAYFTDNTVAKPSLEMQNAVKNAASAFRDLGCEVVEALPPGMEDTYSLIWETLFEGGTQLAELENLLEKVGTKEFSPLHEQYRKLAKKSSFTVSELYGRLFKIDMFKKSMLQFMKEYDIILCPPCATTAKQHGTSFANLKDFTYTMTFNLTGQPAAVVRCGTSSEGLPIGVQVVAKHWRDDVALAGAKYLENIFKGWQRAVVP